RVVYLVFPDGPAGRAGIQTGDTIEAVNGERFNGTRWIEELVGLGATLTVSRHGEAAPFEVEVIPGSFSPYLKPIATPIDDVGYVELFTDVGADQIQYATDANDGIARIQDDVACGWILDLRRNGGGGYFSMTIGTEALLQDGNLLSFVRRDGTVAGRVDLHAGSMYQDGLELTGNLDDVPRADRVAPGTPIAVLIGPATASAAEATAVAYIGQPNTRLFGEKSGGYTVGNNGYLLFDGARLILAESTYVDGNGNQHIGGIVPDEVVKTDLQVYGTTDDPVIQAASVWLREQSGCDMATPVP
ncbi:MAG TPA: S41 family peptidase, partial [Thermomicrobiales bacterium]|nr:S41 family peptidase [Thermomicrobiales bacterium]